MLWWQIWYPCIFLMHTCIYCAPWLSAGKSLPQQKSLFNKRQCASSVQYLGKVSVTLPAGFTTVSNWAIILWSLNCTSKSSDSSQMWRVPVQEKAQSSSELSREFVILHFKKDLETISGGILCHDSWLNTVFTLYSIGCSFCF